MKFLWDSYRFPLHIQSEPIDVRIKSSIRLSFTHCKPLNILHSQVDSGFHLPLWWCCALATRRLVSFLRPARSSVSHIRSLFQDVSVFLYCSVEVNRTVYLVRCICRRGPQDGFSVLVLWFLMLCLSTPVSGWLLAP